MAQVDACCLNPSYRIRVLKALVARRVISTIIVIPAPMRSLWSLVAVGVLLGAPPSVRAAESATASVVVNVQFMTRTTLKVSAEVIRFDVTRPDQAVIAAVDFSAAARTQSGGEVVLTVESLQAIDGSISVRGESVGVGGVLAPFHPVIAGRWIGSGSRAGRLEFSLCSSEPGTYAVPLRFVLSAP
jgi:hypothetical protein